MWGGGMGIGMNDHNVWSKQKKIKNSYCRGECSEFIYETHICIRMCPACFLKSTIMSKNVSDNSTDIVPYAITWL